MQLRTRIITKTVWLVSFISLFTDVASEMLYPVMPVFLQSIGFSVLLIGILEGLAEMVAGLSKGYFGQYSDRLNRRVPFIRWGYAMSALSKPMMAIFSWPAWIFAARTLDRLGKGVRTSARDALLSDETTPEHKGKVFGLHRSMDTVGAAIGPILALLWLHFNPGKYTQLFLLAFFPGLIAVFLTFLLKDKKAPQSSAKAMKGNAGFFGYLRYWKRSGLPYKKIVIGLLAFTLFNSSDAFLLLALKAKGISDTSMILYYVGYNLAYALLSYPVGHWADKIGLHKVLTGGFIIFALVYGGFSQASEDWHFIGLFLLYSVYAACTEGIGKALITNHAKKEETATALGFFNSLASVTAFLASSLGGLLWYAFGAKLMFLFSAAGVLLVVVYFSSIRKNI